jgi:hypothetical protein
MLRGIIVEGEIIDDDGENRGGDGIAPEGRKESDGCFDMLLTDYSRDLDLGLFQRHGDDDRHATRPRQTAGRRDFG